MSDPVLALILIAALLLAVTLAHSFKTLDTGLWRGARVIEAVIAGVLLRFIHAPLPVTAGILLTAVAVLSRLTGRESEPADGMTHGAMTGAIAAIPLASTDSGLLGLAVCILSGAIAGYGITFGLTHVRDRMRQAIVDAITTALAICGAYLPILILRFEVSDRAIAITTVALIPLLIVGAVFKQWPVVREELYAEANLGILDHSDVRTTAHPFLRLGRGGWRDAHAHTEFVRVATKIALRKRQQRGRSEEVARLYQLEVLKLRNQAQEMLRVDRAMRAGALAEPSDTMPSQ